MTKHYFMNKDNGNLLKAEEIWQDAIDNEYDDLTDPTSCEYRNFSLHYSITRYVVQDDEG